MRKIALFILIALSVWACNPKKTVIVSGKIANPMAETVTVKINITEAVDTVALAEDGTFTTEITVEEEQMGTFANGQLNIPVYLVPGSTINFEFDVEDFKNQKTENVQITGEGSKETAFMFSLKEKAIKTGLRELLAFPVDSFTTIMDNASKIVEDEIEIFKSENAPSEAFIKKVRLIQKLNFANNYKYFIMYHPRFAPNDSTPIPDSFQAYIDEIPVDDFETGKEIPAYKFFVIGRFNDKLSEELQADTTLQRGTVVYTQKNADLIAAMDAPQEIKDEIGNRFISGYSYAGDSIREVYKARYKDLIKKQEYLDAFEDIVAKIEALKPGTAAPGFNYPDINGEMVSSESLKGKVIYIDVWATWCGPCKGEIPHLKKLEEELHDEPVAFVSISTDSDKKAWEDMVKEKELKGYQLFAKGAWESDIIKNYAIRGIPRFIMIDKEGKLVNANATRPSNPKTKTELQELAKQ